MGTDLDLPRKSAFQDAGCFSMDIIDACLQNLYLQAGFKSTWSYWLEHLLFIRTSSMHGKSSIAFNTDKGRLKDKKARRANAQR